MMISVDGENYGIIAAAKYEHDPHGNRINTLAPGEYEQPFQFSTKQRDPETGLLYFGLRYRDRERWINRDAIWEAGAMLVRQVARQTAFMPRDTIGERSLTFMQQNPVLATGMYSRDLVPGDPSAGRMEGMRLAHAAIREPNPYAYVLNTPANAIDHIGLKCDPPNGCSYSPDYPLGFKFKPCGDDHDRCYCTCGRTQPECDDTFERCLLRVCDRYLDIAEQTGQLGTPWGEWLANFNFQTCRGLAHTYAGAVRSYGGGAFEAAQRAEGCCD